MNSALFILISLTVLCTSGSEKKVIAVMGGTGMQGGSLVKAILADPLQEFGCRVVTRKPHSPKATELGRKGCQVVYGNLDDIESLKRAFEGAYGVFGVTNYAEVTSANHEVQQGKNLADAATHATVSHTVWSTLESAKDTVKKSRDSSFSKSQDGWVIPAADAKAEVGKYFRQIGISVTELYTSYYLENLLSYGLSLTADGEWVIPMNMEEFLLPVVAVDDIGADALAIFKNRRYINKELYVASDCLTVRSLAEKLTNQLGKKVTYQKLSRDEVAEYESLPLDLAEDLADMFHFQMRYNDLWAGKRRREEVRKLVPNLTSVDDWIRNHKKEILDFMEKKEFQQMEKEKHEM